MSAAGSVTRKLAVDGLNIEVDHVGEHVTVHGKRDARVYVRLRPAGAEPGRDAGPRTSLSLSPLAAERLGLLLQHAAHQTYSVTHVAKRAAGAA